jgi:tetratricopeptide (TPR) repeat protein
MTAEQWALVRQVFEEAMDEPSTSMDGWLAARCGGDARIEDQVRRLLEGHQRGAALLDDVQRSLAAVTKKNLTGCRVGPYALLEKIGEGGMGAVYRATRADDAFHKTVAVKVLGFQLAGAEMEMAFRRERQILAELEHPNIARLLDGGSTNEGLLYLVMELLEGERIDRYCERRGVDLAVRLRLFEEVCEAVGYAHRNLIVHRDVKPGNILVTTDGSVKLLDFGIAKALTGSGEREETMPGRMTPQYASPEQIRGERVGTASDVYSLGLVLYELLTGGVRPYDAGGENLEDAVNAICEKEPPRPSEVCRTPFRKLLRGELDDLVLKALAKSPAMRYTSVEQLREDLLRYRSGRPLVAAGYAFPYRARKFLYRHRRPVAALAVLIATLSAGVVTTLHEANVANRQRIMAERHAAEAEQARRAMEEERSRADRERRHAEERSIEADHQRRLAEDRYKDLRALANTILFDVHDSIKDLPGSVPARKLTVGKAVQYLEALAKNSDGTPGVQAELAAGYERAGDLTGSFFGAGVDGGRAAAPLFEKALALRRKIVKQNPTPESFLALAGSYVKTGDGQASVGRYEAAADAYRQAVQLCRSAPQSAKLGPAWMRTQGIALRRLCGVALSLGADPARAFDSCNEAVATLKALRVINPSDKDAANLLILAEGQLANALRLGARPSEAVGHLRSALELLAELIGRNPNDATLVRTKGGMQFYLALSLEDLHDPFTLDGYASAIATMESSLSLVPEDYSILATLSTGLMKYSLLLHAAGREPEGESAYERTLLLRRRMAEKPKAGAIEFNELAHALNQCPYQRLTNRQVALQFATRAKELTNGRNPQILDTLAWAYYRGGQIETAVETEREALALLPPGSGGLSTGLRQTIEASLAEFQKHSF